MVSVRVPQRDGEIRIAQSGRPAQVWAVVDHVVEVVPGDLGLVLQHVPGATAQPATPDPQPARRPTTPRST
jgi:hypothetical protein